MPSKAKARTSHAVASRATTWMAPRWMSTAYGWRARPRVSRSAAGLGRCRRAPRRVPLRYRTSRTWRSATARKRSSISSARPL